VVKLKNSTSCTSSKNGFFEGLKWNFFMWKMRLLNVILDRQNKKARKKYCRYGYHKLTSNSVGYGGAGQRMKHIRFLKCRHCNYLFFAKKTDKDRYLKYKERYDTRLKSSFSAMLEHSSSAKPKYSKASVSG